MPVEVRLLGWSSEGLRCPDCDVSFETDGGAHPLVLIQMPNGTGKTTTLQLLRAALSGEDPRGDGGIREFQKRGGGGSGTFRLRALCDGERYTFSLSFDFEAGTVAFSTTTPTVGLQDGFHPPRPLRQFLRPEFVRLFVFDGELASHLLDPRRTNAAQAVEDLFRLDLLLGVRDRVREYWDRKTEGGARTSQGLSLHKNALEKLRRRHAEVDAEAASDRERLAGTQERLDRMRARYKDELAKKESVGERLREAEGRRAESAAAVRSAAQQVLRFARGPHALSASFGQEMVSLKEHLDRAKLPESASREFFHELSEEPECVCGRPLDDATREAVRDRAARYLGSDDVSLLNHLKEQVSLATGGDPAEASNQLDVFLGDLAEAVREDDEARVEYELVERDGTQGDPELESVGRTIRTLEAEVGELEQVVKAYDAPAESGPDDRIRSLRELERRRDAAEGKLAEVTRTLALKQKRDVLVRLLETAHGSARDKLSRRLCDEANERVTRLMPYNDIRIREVGQSISLDGQRQGSEGETLAVAYAFLATLFDRAEFKLPFVVDSPTGKIDFAIRRQVGEFIPRLAEQFVAFTTSSERPEFVPALEEAADDVLHLTLFRKGDAAQDGQARQEAHVAETDDGLLVRGREFFHSFQLDADDDGIQAP